MLILAAGENYLYQTLKGKGLGDGSASPKNLLCLQSTEDPYLVPSILAGLLTITSTTSSRG